MRQNDRQGTLSRRDFIKGASALGLSCLLGSRVKAQEKALYTPGTYEGTARGMESEVTVTLTVDETSILEVTVDSSGETDGIGAAAADALAEQILAAQGVMIDGVAGATVTSEAARQAAAIALAKAQGVDVSAVLPAAEEESGEGWLPGEPEIDPAEIREEITCDVLVVGAGNAGLFAAASAVENGARTILVERFGHDMASGIRDTFAAVGSKQQLEDGANPDAGRVSRQLRDWSQGYASPSLVKKFVELSGETIDWYTEVLAQGGMRFLHEIDEQDLESNYEILDVGHSVQYEEEYYEQLTMDKILDYALPLGLAVDYETTLVKLVKEEGKVRGIIAKNAKGDYVRYLASKGTIIATGGYSGNTEMMKALQPWSVEQTCIDYSKPGSKGDGMKACLWAGAAMDETHSAMIFDRGAVRPDSAGKTGDGRLFWMGSQPFLKVNLRGERFMNEYQPYDYVLHTAASQPFHTYATVWDSNYREDIERFATHGCSRIYPHANGAAPVFPMEYIEAMNAGLMEEGFLVQADTLEELAAKLGLPEETFLNTVTRYNQLCEAGEDSDFGKEAYRLSKLQQPPFYGIRQAGGYLICTLDGIKIDDTMHALDAEGSPIPGLYVCGDASGCYFSGSYPNLLSGAAAGRTATFGRLAGKLAALSEDL